eukprot:6115485-Amphidinium_carterae.1
MKAKAGLSLPDILPGDAVEGVRQGELGRTVFLLYAVLVSSQGRCRCIAPGKQCKGPLQLAPDTGHRNGAYVPLCIFVERDQEGRL